MTIDLDETPTEGKYRLVLDSIYICETFFDSSTGSSRALSGFQGFSKS